MSSLSLPSVRSHTLAVLMLSRTIPELCYRPCYGKLLPAATIVLPLVLVGGPPSGLIVGRIYVVGLSVLLILQVLLGFLQSTTMHNCLSLKLPISTSYDMVVSY